MAREHWYMSVEYDTSDYDELLRELEDEPHADTIIRLESILSTAFAATQAKVHVITGRLRASGRISSSITDGHWSGEITYGGPGTGVEYAWYEERRGGHHDYMEPAEGLDDAFAEAILRTVGDES